MYTFKLMKQFLIIPLILILSITNSCSNSRPQSQKLNNFQIESRSSWNAMEAREYKSHTVVRITVHHEGTKLELTDDAAKKINAIQRWGMGKDKNWTDIPYHFLIAPNGTIYEGRNPNTVGETSTEYDPTGHLLICCLGDLGTQPVPDEQLQSLIKLIAFTSNKFKIPIDSLRTHKDYSKQTSCPGKNLSTYFENGYIKAELRKLR